MPEGIKALIIRAVRIQGMRVNATPSHCGSARQRHLLQAVVGILLQRTSTGSVCLSLKPHELLTVLLASEI